MRVVIEIVVGAGSLFYIRLLAYTTGFTRSLQFPEPTAAPGCMLTAGQGQRLDRRTDTE